MNVTIADVIGYEDYMRELSRRDRNLVLGLLAYSQESSKKELNILNSRSSACPLSSLKDYKMNKLDIDMARLKDLANGEFYNADVLELMACTLDAMFYTSPGDYSATLASGEITKSMITRFRQIGDNSAYGYALSGDIQNQKDMFVVKVPRGGSGKDLRHELFTGLMATNKLRYRVPNYAYVFGGFGCAAPIIDETTKKVINWCGSTDQTDLVPYVIYENIAPGETLTKMLKNCSYAEFMSAYIQIISALIVGNQTIDFTHYDLHTDNIVMRDVSKHYPGDFQIPYSVREVESTYYVTCNRVATMIDYGRSFVRYDGEGYGMPSQGEVSLSLYPDRSWCLYDSYKLLLFCAYHAIRYDNLDLLPAIRTIFRFFNKTDSLEDTITAQFEARFSIPMTRETVAYDNVDLLFYIFETCDVTNVVSVDSSNVLPIMDCSTCTNLSYLGPSVGAESGYHYKPVNMLEFYDLQRFLYINDRKAAAKAYKDFDYKSAIIKHERTMKELMAVLDRRIAKFKSINLSGFNLGNYQTLVMIQSEYNAIFEIISDLESLDIYNLVAIEVAELYGCEWPESIKESVAKINGRVCPLISGVIDTIKTVQRYMTTEKWLRDLSRDRRLEWYKTLSDSILITRYEGCYVSYPPKHVHQVQEEVYTDGSDDTVSITRTVDYDLYKGQGPAASGSVLDSMSKLTLESMGMLAMKSPKSLTKLFSL